MSDERETDRQLEQLLEDGPTAAPLLSRATIRGRVHETRQRTSWLVSERGDVFPRRRTSLRLLAIAAALVALLGISTVVGSLGGRPIVIGPSPTPRLTTFPVDGQPLGIAAASDAIWVAMFDRASVTRLDVETTVQTSILVGGRNCVSISAGAGAVWVPSCSRGPLTRIDPASNEADIIALDSGQRTAPVFDGNIAWITLDIDSGQFLKHDAVAGQELFRGRLPRSGVIVAVGFGSVWAVTGPYDRPDTLLRLDPGSGAELASIPLGETLDMAVVGQDAIWLTTFDQDGADATLLRIDPELNSVVATIPFAAVEIRAVTDGTRVWVLELAAPSHIYLIDQTTNSATLITDVGGSADGIAVDIDTLWVTRGRTSDVVRVDLTP